MTATDSGMIITAIKELKTGQDKITSILLGNGEIGLCEQSRNHSADIQSIKDNCQKVQAEKGKEVDKWGKIIIRSGIIISTAITLYIGWSQLKIMDRQFKLEKHVAEQTANMNKSIAEKKP